MRIKKSNVCFLMDYRNKREVFLCFYWCETDELANSVKAAG